MSDVFHRMRRRAAVSIAVAAGMLLIGTSGAAEPIVIPDSAAVPLQDRHFGSWGIDFTYQDAGVRPGDDFYRRLNARWLDNVSFGPNVLAQAYWRELRLLTPKRLIAILQSDDATIANTPAGKASTIFRAYHDHAKADSLGFTPLRAELDRLKAVKDRSQLARMMGALAGPETIRAPSVYGPPVGWSFFRLDNIDQDHERLNQNAIYLAAGGLILPGTQYYLEDQFADVRRGYAGYIAKMLSYEGWPDAAAQAEKILKLETEIAKASWSPEQMLDASATFNRLSVKQLQALAPSFDWSAYFGGAGLGGAKEVVIDAKSSFPKIAEIYAKTPLETLKARHAFALADQRNDLLDSRALAAAIQFRGQELGNGVYFGAAPIELRSEKEVEGEIPDIATALYLQHYSSPSIKTTVERMAEDMRGALDQRLKNLSWMTPEHRQLARQKLARMQLHIGYPNRLETYDDLKVFRDDPYGNHMRAADNQWKLLVARLGHPYDPSRWSIRAEYATFNYNPAANTVEISAGLLVPPFFDEKADEAVNYGAAGTILGAMIAAPFFTQQGLAYDPTNHLHKWLSDPELNAFQGFRHQIAAQYSKVEPLPGMPLRGELVADEALGDLVGLQIALDGFHRSHPTDAAKDGYLADQRFFLGRAQLWRAKFIDSFVKSQIATGSNEPPFMRVNGLLPNMDAWYEAFDVQSGDRLFIPADQRVRPW